MKKMMSMIVAGFAGLAVLNAAEGEVNTNAGADSRNAIQIQEQFAPQDSVSRTLIEPADLPEGIQETLRGDDYMGWVVVTAYLVEAEGQDSYYEVSLQREGEENLRIVLFNPDGTIRE